MANFDCFAPEALRFLEDLKANNTKDWFTANKATYEAHIKEPGKTFAAEMADALSDLAGKAHISKIFRINRDVRFSKDKTPYNAHLHLAFTPERQTGQPPMWFFGLSPKKLSLGCGVFQYDKTALTKFRATMAGPKGAELIALGKKLHDQGLRVGEPELKRIPSGFDKDHPNGDALRRKGFAGWIDKNDAGFAARPNLVARTIDELTHLLPVFSLLSRIG